MNKTNFSLGALIAVIGLILLVAPEASIKVVVILLGAGAIINGLYDLIKMRQFSEDNAFHIAVIVRGIASIVVGLVALSLPLAFFNAAQTVVRVLLYVLGVYLVLTAGMEFFLMLKLPEDSVVKKTFIYEGLGTLAVGIILFLLPANFGVIIVRILGILLIAGGLVYMFFVWKSRPIVVEAEDVRDEDAAGAENVSESTESAE